MSTVTIREAAQAAIEHAADLLAERRHAESAPDALMAMRHEVAEWVVRASETEEGETTPAAGEDVRERVKGAWATVEAAALAQANVLDSHYGGQPAKAAEIRNAVEQVAALLRAPRGDGKAVRLLGLAMERAELLCRDAGRAEWPPSDFGRDMLQARLDTVRDLIGDALAALRSESAARLGEGGGE